MLKMVEGDILLSGADAIAHGVAPNDDFHQGLALQLREQWPALYKDFRHYCHTEHPDAGGVWVWQGAGGKPIVNLLTQEGTYGKGAKPGKAQTDFVNKALKNLRKEIEENGWEKIAITKVATGVGGLDWKAVKPLLEKNLGDLKATVYVYETFHKGVKAKES